MTAQQATVQCNTQQREVSLLSTQLLTWWWDLGPKVFSLHYSVFSIQPAQIADGLGALNNRVHSTPSSPVLPTTCGLPFSITTGKQNFGSMYLPWEWVPLCARCRMMKHHDLWLTLVTPWVKWSGDTACCKVWLSGFWSLPQCWAQIHSNHRPQATACPLLARIMSPSSHWVLGSLDSAP